MERVRCFSEAGEGVSTCEGAVGGIVPPRAQVDAAPALALAGEAEQAGGAALDGAELLVEHRRRTEAGVAAGARDAAESVVQFPRPRAPA